MKTAICKNCGPLPVGEFYPNLNTKDRKPMNVCKRCHRVRTREAQRRRGWDYKPTILGMKRFRKHGTRAYQSGCRCESCRAAHAEYARRLRAKNNEVLQNAVQLKLFVETQIRLLTKNGASRNAIKEATKAPWDIIGDTLAEMWDRGEVFTRKHGEDRYFYLKKAA